MSNVVQTTVTTAPLPGAPGLPYDSSSFMEVIHKVALEDIPFGVFVKITGDGAELPDSSAEVTATSAQGGGVAVLDQTKPSADGYKTGDIVAVMTAGRIWMVVESGQSIPVMTQPFVRFAAGTGTQKGALRSDADTATAVASPRLKLHTTGGSGLAVVDVIKAQ